MNINDILNSLGLDLANPEVKRGALEAIEAILNSRSTDGGGGEAPGGEIELELDPDLIQPSVKNQPQDQMDSSDIEIEDDDKVLDQIKHNDSEQDSENNTSGTENNRSDSQKSDPSTDSEEKNSDELNDDNTSEQEAQNDSDTEDIRSDEDNDQIDGKYDNIDSELDNEESDGTTGELADEDDFDSESGETPDEILDDDDIEDSEFDETDLLDDKLKNTYDDENITNKQSARKIKRERTLAAAKKALEDAKSRKVAPALIRELESAITALEELNEAATKKHLNDLSDEEFNLLINRVFDAIDAVGDTSLTYSSDEEREAKAQEIKADLSSSKTQAELSAEDIAQIRAEHQAVQAREKENAKYARRNRRSFKGFQEFLNSLYRAIALQVSTEESNDDTWSAINRRYSGSSVLQPGKRLNDLPNKKIPVIDFYFDQSGSWTESDIEVGKKAVAKLADMEADGQIKINVYYFANNVHTDAASARAEGGTWGWNEIVKNVIATQATNVVIMTDSDMENIWDRSGYYSHIQGQALSYTVPGYVWYLWRDGENAPRLPRDLKGRGGVQQFSFSSSDL